MGNHEYCVDCGANDFHHSRPCDPKRLAAMEEQKRLAEERRKARRQELEELKSELVAKGWDVIFNEYDELEVRGRKQQQSQRPAIDTLSNLRIPIKGGGYRHLWTGRDGVKAIEVLSYGFAEADPEFRVVYDDGRVEEL